VVPLIRAIAEGLPGVPISVDTVRSRVARAALDAGAHIINDVSGFRLDPDMACVCAMADAGVVLMHSRGDVERMASYDQASYEGDVVEVVRSELQKGLDAAFAAGVDPARVAVDPGIGFSKRSEHSLRLLANLHRIRELGHPVMVGVSRKRFIGEITGRAAPAERVAGTVAANVAALVGGAVIFRVHDVRENREALDVAWAVLRERASGG
jgi:dihydropteroate synthase